MLQRLRARLRSLWNLDRQESELDQEIRFHLSEETDERVAAGLSPDQARLAAKRDFGNVTRIREATRDVWIWPWLQDVSQDVRYALRGLRRNPGFSVVILLTLALTIGPTTAILSVGNWLLWRPVPGVAAPDRLAVIWFGEWRGRRSVSPRFVSDPNIEDLRRGSRTIGAVAGWQELEVSFAVEGVPPQRVGSAHATANFFEVLGVRPVAGRTFTSDEDVPPYGSPVAVTSHDLARRVFGRPEDAIGQSVLVNGRTLTIVGVLPRGFVGASPFSDVDIWHPSSTYSYVNHFPETAMERRVGRARGGIFYTFVARLAPTATFDALQAELDVRVPALAEQYPDDNQAFETIRARVFPRLGPPALQRDQYRDLVRNLLLVGGVLLMLGCANITNLLISRGTRRRREYAVRIALGASRSRLVHLLLAESCVLAVAGATLGVGLAVWLKEVMQTLLLPGSEAAGVDLSVPMDLRVLGATLGVSVACGLAAGLAPAWIGSATRSSSLGRDDLRTATQRPRLRAGLAVAQLALSLALVTNAMLLATTLWNLGDVELGFDPRGVTIHSVELSSHGYTPERSLVYARDVLERVSADPLVVAASLSRRYPFGSGHVARVTDPRNESESLDVYTDFVSGDYFRALGMSLAGGRTFTAAETFGATATDGSPVIVGARLARRLFGEANPIGQRVAVPATMADPAHSLLVVGVAPESRRRGLTREPDLMMWVPFAYGGSYAASSPVLLVRSDQPTRVVGERVQAHGTAIDPSLPFAAPRPLTMGIERELAERRVFAWVLSLLGALGFALAGVGLFGLLAQLVGERTREFGIRMAIGADRAHVVGLVLRQAAWIAMLGAAAGLGLAAFGSRFVETQLFGLTALEPSVYLVSAVALAVVVFVASLWPVFLATRIQPAEALRTE